MGAKLSVYRLYVYGRGAPRQSRGINCLPRMTRHAASLHSSGYEPPLIIDVDRILSRERGSAQAIEGAAAGHRLTDLCLVNLNEAVGCRSYCRSGRGLGGSGDSVERRYQLERLPGMAVMVIWLERVRMGYDAPGNAVVGMQKYRV